MSEKSREFSFIVLNGPNLNLLGLREPDVYGRLTLEKINELVVAEAAVLGVDVSLYQSNHEGALVDKIQDALGKFDAIIINPGAYTHTSVAIRDAIKGVGLPCIEVHLSNIYARESFRSHSYISPVCVGQIAGLGYMGYMLAMRGLKEILSKSKSH